jgi:hypothetical protein
MQNFKTLRQPLLGELAMSWRERERREREREREKNAIYSGHLRLCQQPRAAHALRSDQNLGYDFGVVGEVFEGDSAETCAGKFSLVSMGGRAKGQACADGERGPPSAQAEIEKIIT